MRIIDRSLQTVRSLSVVEEEALRLFALNKSAPPDVLARIRLKQFWLACDCRYPAPVMHVAQRDGARLSLKNNPDGDEHAPDCVFGRTENDAKNNKSAPGHSLARVSPSGHIALHSEFQASGKGNGQQISRSSAIQKQPPKALLSMLLSLMELAELDTYCPARPVTITDQYSALRHAAGRFVLSPAIPLSHILDTRITKQRLVAMAKRLRETDTFGNARRYGLLMDVVSKTGPRQLIVDDEVALDFFGNAEALHGRSAPLLTLATVAAQEHGSSYYQLGKAAFVPVLSRHQLFPVVGDQDRQVVKEVFGLLRWLHEKKGVTVTASRDLFQIGAGYGMVLKSGGQLIELDLNPSPLDSDSPLPNSLALSGSASLDAMKKRLTALLIKGA